jgi:hypothetical protein
VHHFGGFFGQAKFAIKVPKVSAFWHVTAAFSLKVFANVVLGGFQQTLGVLAFDLK